MADPGALCRRCGGTLTIKTPVDVTDLLADLDRFRTAHRNCREMHPAHPSEGRR